MISGSLMLKCATVVISPLTASPPYTAFQVIAWTCPWSYAAYISDSRAEDSERVSCLGSVQIHRLCVCTYPSGSYVGKVGVFTDAAENLATHPEPKSSLQLISSSFEILLTLVNF
jgi:hypothetical protein